MLDSTSSALLPTASAKQVVAAMRRLVGEQRWPALWLLLMQGGATLAGLVGPWALGVVVEAATQHQLGKVVVPVVLLFLAATLVRTGLSYWAGRRGGVLGSHV
ncbi:MAG: hypothetical protein WB020_10415, partial [Candidatus Dormiibacterota bacterium]